MVARWKMLVALGAFVSAVTLTQAQSPSGPAALLSNKSVQEELKLTDEEVTKAKEALVKVLDSHKENYAKIGELKAEEQRKKRAELNKIVADECRKALSEILKPDQVKRLSQIEMQHNLNQVGPGAFLSAEFRNTLKLNPEQRKKIAAIRDEYRKDKKAAGRSKEAQEKLLKETMEKIHNVLTAEQKTALKDALGETFEVKMEGKPGKKTKEKSKE